MHTTFFFPRSPFLTKYYQYTLWKNPQTTLVSLSLHSIAHRRLRLPLFLSLSLSLFPFLYLSLSPSPYPLSPTASLSLSLSVSFSLFLSLSLSLHLPPSPPLRSRSLTHSAVLLEGVVVVVAGPG